MIIFQYFVYGHWDSLNICSRGTKGRLYFYACYAAYILGLGLTIFVMHFFKHAQVSYLKNREINQSTGALSSHLFHSLPLDLGAFS